MDTADSDATPTAVVKDTADMTPVPFVVAPEQLSQAAPAESAVVENEFQCNWENCQVDCKSQRGLVMHVTEHVQNLDWYLEHVYR